jgi:PAS domain S-box-containing protein
LPELLDLSEERRLQLLVGSVIDYAIYMLDQSGRIATWNPGAERFKGYSANEVIGEHYSRFFTPEDVAADLPGRALRIAAREGRFESEGWRVRKDGSRFWAHVVVDPIRGEDGELIGFAKVTRDVTDRRDREQALFESEQRFRMLVQGVRDYAIYMLDRDGYITNWNAGAEKIKGYSADEIIGQHFSRFYTEEDRAGGEPARALSIALNEGKYEREAQRVRKDGSLFWASVVIDPIFDEIGQHIGYAKITRDVTERKKAEQELEVTREALVQSQKLQALGELTGGIAHDFNNLMTVIAGASDFLLKHPNLPQEKQKRYLAAIAETVDRATSLTNHLLAFGRRQSLKPVVLDLSARLDAFAEMVGRMLGSPIRVALDLQSADARVEVDVAQLESALLNAAVNARDAMPDGGQLTIGTSDCEHEGKPAVCIDITDSGTGITPETLKRVFEPFFTTKEVGKGTGLGLSQIHGFAAQAGGRAEVDSREGEGTTVRIILPRTDKPMTEQESEVEGPPIPHGLKVLLVEDNEQVRGFASQLLKDLHCEVIAVAGGAEALKLCKSEAPDLVFSDVVMPGLSGMELAKQLAGQCPDIPVLLATGYSDELLGDDARKFKVVSKPYDIGTLGKAIGGLLNSSREKA